MTSVTPRGAFLTRIANGGQSVVAIYSPGADSSGAIIVNPYAASDQNLDIVETLYVSLTGPAALVANATTFAIQPGGVFIVPAGTTTDIWVNAATAGHMFSAVVIGGAIPFTPFTGLFPPDGPTTLTKTILSYLYKEYDDDEDLQAFVNSFNALAQEYVDWFANASLPIYTGLTGTLLDWVATGLYGMARPALPSGLNANIGPLNTWTLNQIPLNTILRFGNQDYVATTDDVFKRILTWHFYKGDGKIFTVDWLKRRVMRFLEGTDGIAPLIDQTYRISVTFGVDKQVNINLLRGKRTVLGGCMPNGFGCNFPTPLNSLRTSFVSYPAIPLAPILKAGIDSGALELPFQFTYVVNVT